MENAEKIKQTTEMLQRVFPYSRKEGLKIYALLSVKSNLANLVTHETAEVLIYGAYSMDEAVRENNEAIRERHPKTHADWIAPRLIASQPFEMAVPGNEVMDMVDKLKSDLSPLPTSILDVETDKLISHARYLFEQATASPYEKGVLTGIINRINKKNGRI